MKIIKTTLLILIFFTWINNIFAEETETSNINWERYSISKVYNESKRKLTFLIQYKVTSEPSLDYKYFTKILTSERKRTCDWEFIYTQWAIYTICSVKIDDKKTLNENIDLFFEVEEQESHDTEIKFKKSYIQEIKSEDKIENKVKENTEKNSENKIIIQNKEDETIKEKIIKEDEQKEETINKEDKILKNKILKNKIENRVNILLNKKENKLEIIEVLLEQIENYKTLETEKIKLIKILKEILINLKNK